MDLDSYIVQVISDIVALMEELLNNTRSNVLAALVAAVMSVPLLILALFYVSWAYL